MGLMFGIPSSEPVLIMSGIAQPSSNLGTYTASVPTDNSKIEKGKYLVFVSVYDQNSRYSSGLAIYSSEGKFKNDATGVTNMPAYISGILDLSKPGTFEIEYINESSNYRKYFGYILYKIS